MFEIQCIELFRKKIIKNRIGDTGEFFFPVMKAEELFHEGGRDVESNCSPKHSLRPFRIIS